MSHDFVCKPVRTEHADIIHDVSFDHHGNRMATCSSDQTVKVWDKGDDGNWRCTASWRTHSGSVWRVTWAHPEFGQILATCSYDRTVAVWEEMSKGLSPRGGRDPVAWPNKASLVDSRTSVTDVRFGPKHLGLLLAACSTDGIVRIYEAVDVMKLSNWPLHHEFAVTFNDANVSLSCLSWSSSRLHPSMIAVGSDDKNRPSDPKVFIYLYNDTRRKWDLVIHLSWLTEPVNDVQFAPHLGRSFHMLAVASRDLHILTIRDVGESSQSITRNPLSETFGNSDDGKSLVWRVSWSVLGNKLVSTGSEGVALVWKADYRYHFKCHQKLDTNQAPLRINPNRLALPDVDQLSLNFMGGSMSSTPSSSHIRFTPPASMMAMNIKRVSGWPLMDTDPDQVKHFY